jgi:hypothetical protein
MREKTREEAAVYITTLGSAKASGQRMKFQVEGRRPLRQREEVKVPVKAQCATSAPVPPRPICRKANDIPRFANPQHLLLPCRMFIEL